MHTHTNINSNGHAGSFLTCSGDASIKRSCQARQLTLASLTTLANQTFKTQTGYTNFKAWKDDLENKSTASKFWFTVIEFEKLLFIFLCSLRESKFNLLIRCFMEMLSWLAALDNIHYLRCVYLMKRLPETILDHMQPNSSVSLQRPVPQTITKLQNHSKRKLVAN